MNDYNQYLNTKVMNRWVLDSYVGRGQSGIVFKAHGPQGENVAVKIISIPNEQQIKECEIAYGGDPELMESFFEQIANRFVAETESLKKLTSNTGVGSKNIVRYIDHVASKKDMEWEIIIVMEFVQSLKDYFQNNRLDVGTVVNLGIDIATGLEHCQSMKVIHRDIKDDNIFADAQGNFKIGDFGVANNASATRASTKVGTPYYMAPEVQNGSEYTANVDVYSLGIVLYKLMNYGRFPLAPSVKEKAKLLINDNDNAFKRRMAGDTLPDPEFCPDNLKAIIRKACEFRPEDRYANATEMKNALMAVRNTMTKEEWEQELPAPIRKVEKTVMPKRDVAIAEEPPKFDPTPIMQSPAPQPVAPPQPSVSPSLEQTQGNYNRAETQNMFEFDPNAQRKSMATIAMPDQPEYVEENDAGMKTTAMIESLMNQGGMSAAIAKKLAEKTRGQEKAEGEIRGLKRKGKGLKAGIIAAAVVAVLAIAVGVFLWPNTYSYNANSDDNYYLYKYQFGVPKKRILKDGVEPVPASYVKSDGNWIYFSLHDKPFEATDDHQLYKIKKNGEDMTLICEDHCEYNIVFEDWIYYLNNVENNALYRIRTDGTDREMLINEAKITSMSMEKNNGKIKVNLENGSAKMLDVNDAEDMNDILISDVKE